VKDTSIAGDQPVRIAYSISRKVGNAVVRNRLRRRLKAVFSEVFASSAPPPVTSALVIVLPGAARSDFADLHGQVMELMKKVEKSTGSVA
jgi:ribonuclease P protein component